MYASVAGVWDRIPFVPSEPGGGVGTVYGVLPHWPAYCVIWKLSVPGGAGIASVTVVTTLPAFV